MRRLAMMNLAMRGIEGDLGPVYADTFRRDLHKDLNADDVLANPPFNDSDWHRSDEVIALLTSIESPQRNPHGHFVRMRRIKALRQMPHSL